MKQRQKSKYVSPRARRPPKFERYSIPQSKLERALEFLHSDSSDRAVHRPCHGNILNRANAGRKQDRCSLDTVNLQEVARICADRGQWPELMKTVAIMCEDPHYQDVHAILRNALFGIIADPSLNDPSYLEAYLYSCTACKNPGDITYCMDKILEVFQGVTIRPKHWRRKNRDSS
ncbi:uncharacterized protein LOC129721823 [Wyeomyia smithii]|uniref:uncharacterized protein LOC129721823 n=1 Tax=Wyeomyia smithii TaxID=174621 RepID=UPI002467B7DB|nr:uncharacterized protein LOC129721823 [Wyeomyia smithii]